MAEAEEPLARLRHPNIVQIYRLGNTTGPAPTSSFEYGRRGEPSPATPRDGTLAGPREAARLVETLGPFCHDGGALASGVITADLKPANVSG